MLVDTCAWGVQVSPRIHANHLNIREDWRGLADSGSILKKPCGYNKSPAEEEAGEMLGRYRPSRRRKRLHCSFSCRLHSCPL